ncbi:hypothetical protein SAMN04487833_1376 [Sarcina sp. DSM 11001]|nr:hypothetical protein SAMN04487833_1376 [Sarcina sp. DSM 11001]
MTSYLMSTIDPRKLSKDNEYNSFRPAFQFRYDRIFSPAYKFIRVRDKDGNIIVRKYDIFKCEYVDQ